MSFQAEDESITPVNNTNTDDYQKGILPSVRNGRWERRRHGMNLEEMRVSFRDVDVDKQHTTSSMTNNEQGSSERPPQQNNGSIKPNDCNTIKMQPTEADVEGTSKAQEKMIRMDAQSRFLCRMLDDLYRTGIWREIDRPTVERCHRAIGRLLTMTPSDKNPPKANETQPEISITGLAQRAGAILQRMEQCSPLALRANKPSKKSATNLIPEEGNMDATQNNASSYQGMYSNYPQHLAFTKFVLPTPTRAIYNMVLLSYSKEAGAMHIAQQAEDVVWGMIVRGSQQARQGSDDSDTTNMDSIANDDKEATTNGCLFPSVDNWNCVMKCWSKSTHADRAFHSYSFMLSWLEWNKDFQDKDSSSKSSSGPNAESFQLVLQSCLVNDTIDGKDEMKGKEATEIQQRTKEMGSRVAIRLWQNSDLDISIDSINYYRVMQAICQTSELPSLLSLNKSLAALARVFSKCCEDGMITPEILVLVRGATTESQFAQLKAKVVENSTQNNSK